ncbi:60S ribosomal protein L21 [Asimina triloba]
MGKTSLGGTVAVHEGNSGPGRFLVGWDEKMLARQREVQEQSRLGGEGTTMPSPSKRWCQANDLNRGPRCVASESFEPESAAPDPAESTEVVEPDRVEESDDESAQLAEVSSQVPKGIDIFAVVMVGSRQYIVIPGRSIHTQRLKGANVNDKIVLNKVLLVGTKSEAYIGKPVVTNAAVHAVVEEQGLNKKVVVFKFKRKKNYRRNIGHRQPNTRLRITGITGYEDYPVSTLAAA